MKMRIQGGKVQDAVARELGAIPQILAFGVLYQALQTGVVDGEDNVPSNIWTQKFYDVQNIHDCFPSWTAHLRADYQQQILEIAATGRERAA